MEERRSNATSNILQFVILGLLVILFCFQITHETVVVEHDDTYEKYLIEANKINQRIDSIKFGVNTIKLEKNTIKEKFYYEREKVTTYDVDQLDSVIRLHSGL